MLFDQRLIHAVNPAAYKFDLRRKHMNIRLTKQTEPLHGNIRELLTAGAVIPLKSGQMPPLYPDSYDVNWQDKLIDVYVSYSLGISH